MFSPIRVREEDWGRIVYDSGLDEFEAHVSEENKLIRVTRPISAGCLITGKCNLQCAFCYGNDESLPKTELSLDRWETIFYRLRSWGLMRVDLSGGEPTVRCDLPAIATAALNAGLNVVISTNGIRLSEKGPSGFPPVRWHVSMDSGIAEIHEDSRLLRSLKPSKGSFEKTSNFILKCVEQNLPVRVLTCVGVHNKDVLFALAEHLALLGVREWNISRILRAGRAQVDYEHHFHVTDDYLLEQVHSLRSAFPFIRIRYSNRTDQTGYFLLVLPDSTVATQYTDGRDKVTLRTALEVTLQDLRNWSEFHLEEHGQKWISAHLTCQKSESDFSTVCSTTRNNPCLAI